MNRILRGKGCGRLRNRLQKIVSIQLSRQRSLGGGERLPKAIFQYKPDGPDEIMEKMEPAREGDKMLFNTRRDKQSRCEAPDFANHAAR